LSKDFNANFENAKALKTPRLVVGDSGRSDPSTRSEREFCVESFVGKRMGSISPIGNICICKGRRYWGLKNEEHQLWMGMSLLRAVYFILAIGLFVFERAVSSNAWFDGE
jgi:hypothetical protein